VGALKSFQKTTLESREKLLGSLCSIRKWTTWSFDSCITWQNLFVFLFSFE